MSIDGSLFLLANKYPTQYCLLSIPFLYLLFGQRYVV